LGQLNNTLPPHNVEKFPPLNVKSYNMQTRDTAFDWDKFLSQERSGVGESAASLAAEGSGLALTRWQPCDAAASHA
jgi:hypothetical protein